MAKELADILDEEIAALGRESSRHKRQYRTGQTSVILLTAASTVISAWALRQEAPSKDAYLVIVIVTALATAISAWMEMRKSRDLWQHERPIYHALRDLRRELDFLGSINELSTPKKRELFERMGQILGQTTKKWVQLSKDKEPGPPLQSEPITIATPGDPAAPGAIRLPAP